MQAQPVAPVEGSMGGYENSVRRAPDNADYRFDPIVGNSRALEAVLDRVERVGPTNATVLILGETGTGKELIAQAIHNTSSRCSRRLVKLNCAAIPHDLLESELFGHEKGAFTGAIAQRLGRFELAHQGTLFLDEVGDIPLGLQSKLLRVLQEHEFERLGSGQTHKVDVRVIAATHCNLAHLVASNEFRRDLYYRLNVFPILIPPLRERREDIPLLVNYFVQKHSRQMQKHIHTVSEATLKELVSWDWPGNIRELENFIERAVILCSGPELRLEFSDLIKSGVTKYDSSAKPSQGNLQRALQETERRWILYALEQSRWVIAGPHGAAAYLGVKRTTLHARMQKLGITRAHGSAGLADSESSNEAFV